jgi:hypothetical protein
LEVTVKITLAGEMSAIFDSAFLFLNGNHYHIIGHKQKTTILFR